VPYLSASAVVFHYQKALYQVYEPLPLPLPLPLVTAYQCRLWSNKDTFVFIDGTVSAWSSFSWRHLSDVQQRRRLSSVFFPTRNFGGSHYLRRNGLTHSEEVWYGNAIWVMIVFYRVSHARNKGRGGDPATANFWDP